MSQQEIENTINDLWDLYDTAKSAGDTETASEVERRALSLISQLPENCVFLTKH